MIEDSLDIRFVAELAFKEKQLQQYYRPVIAVHKWFARRPGTLFRSLILAEFCSTEGPLRDIYYRSHNLGGLCILDPFMGGGTPIIEANRLSCDVIGLDINPMACWVTREALEPIDLSRYREAAEGLIRTLEGEIGHLYKTACVVCGALADVKSFLWVKTHSCPLCGTAFDLFPGYMLAANERHPNYVLVCGACGELNEVADVRRPGACGACGRPLRVQGPARRNLAECPRCGAASRYPVPDNGPPRHRMFAIEYYCLACAPSHTGRFFKRPDGADLARYEEAAARLREIRPRFIPGPDERIPPGDETNRLLRWGYRCYRDLFNDRQLLGLELSARAVAALADERVRRALITNLSDLLRYQNMLCRYDPVTLKTLDIFSVHGFPVSLIQSEANLLGVPRGEAALAGSGGWRNIIEKYLSAKAYCDQPYEFRADGGRAVRVLVPGEWVGDRKEGRPCRSIRLECRDARSLDLPPESVDAVFTDPPYFGNVQYGELMEFCHIWVRKLAAPDDPFLAGEVRNPDELTGNATLERGLESFTEGLSQVFRRAAAALKAGGPFVFTYHHNRVDAYHPVVVAILDAGLRCTAAFPCPAEMGGSVHINRTQSAIVDTVFVCRHPTARPNSAGDGDLAALVRQDLATLRAAGVSLRDGDLKCILYGRVAQRAVNILGDRWNDALPVTEKLKLAAACFEEQLRAVPLCSFSR
jgi:putative DNA methylase